MRGAPLESISICSRFPNRIDLIARCFLGTEHHELEAHRDLLSVASGPRRLWKGRGLHVLQPAYLDFFAASLRALDALKRGTVIAGILIFFRVCGLTPVRAFLLLTKNVPRSVTRILPFFFLSESWIAEIKAFSADAAALLVISASSAIRLTSSALVIASTP